MPGIGPGDAVSNLRAPPMLSRLIGVRHPPSTREMWVRILPSQLMNIERDLLEELTSFKVGTGDEGWTVVADFHLGSRRWVEERRIILSHDTTGDLYGFDYERGLTEMQEFYWPDYYPEQIELFEVETVEVTKIEYTKVNSPASLA